MYFTFNSKDVVNLRLGLKQVLVLGCWNFDWLGLVVLIVSESNFPDICHLDIYHPRLDSRKDIRLLDLVERLPPSMWFEVLVLGCPCGICFAPRDIFRLF